MTPRYFTDGDMFWKATSEGVQARSHDEYFWDDSACESVEDITKDSTVREITAEEGELQ